MLMVLFLAVLTFRARTALPLGLVSFPLKISLPEKKKLLNSPFKMLVCIHIKVHKAMFPFFLCKIFFIVRVYPCTWVIILLIVIGRCILTAIMGIFEKGFYSLIVVRNLLTVTTHNFKKGVILQIYTC